ncbi:MAG: aminopeptidase P family protein [Rikenellaceae bacterium]
MGLFGADTYVVRRAKLRQMVGDGVILIPANLHAPNSYPNNPYYFRQDSSFRYLFGINEPSLVGVLDCDSGEDRLFGDNPTLTDMIWTGDLPSLSEMASAVGVTKTASTSELYRYVAEAQSSGRAIHILPPYRGETKLQLSDLLGIHPKELDRYFSAELIFAMSLLREVKSGEEIAELEDAYTIGLLMHTTAMRMTRAGVTEREVSGVLAGIAQSQGGGVSFPTIYTQHGEILHNTSQDGVLTDGRLVLCDAGAENLAGYCSDHTRTYPVSGSFSPIQRDIYNTVLEAHYHVREIAHAGMLYSDLHRSATMKLAEGLRDIGLVRGSLEEIEASEAIKLFMPHGVGHSLGMDVHDCEAFGERSFDYAKYEDLARETKTGVCRKYWQLREGSVITNEPGVYFIGALIDQSLREGLYTSTVNYDLINTLRDFGGIRIEDDLAITAEGCREIGAENPIPKSIAEIESFMNR